MEQCISCKKTHILEQRLDPRYIFELCPEVVVPDQFQEFLGNEFKVFHNFNFSLKHSKKSNILEENSKFNKSAILFENIVTIELQTTWRLWSQFNWLLLIFHLGAIIVNKSSCRKKIYLPIWQISMDSVHPLTKWNNCKFKGFSLGLWISPSQSLKWTHQPLLILICYFRGQTWAIKLQC